MADELDWILAQDEETGRVVRKPRRRPVIEGPKKPRRRPEKRPAKAPALPASFYADVFPTGLSIQEADALYFIKERGVVSIRDLVEHLFDDPADERSFRAKARHTKVVLSHIRSKIEIVGYTIHRPMGGFGLASSFFYVERAADATA